MSMECQNMLGGCLPRIWNFSAGCTGWISINYSSQNYLSGAAVFGSVSLLAIYNFQWIEHDGPLL